MIPRYSRPEMARIWSQEAKYDAWLKVELAVCEVYARRGIIPADALGRIKAAARVSAPQIDEIETKTRHDVIAFLTNLEESIGADSRYVHLGMTSSDVVDTAQALQLVAASELLQGGLERLRAALWFAEAGRNLERLRRAKEAVRVGKISGAVGNFAHVDPDVEEEVCRLLGLEPAPVSTQVIQRDRHAEFCSTLALVATSLEKVATEIRSLQRTEILEAEEPFTEGQKGSSAMPHKRNPVSCEQVCGLARLVRSNSLAALENVALWHERDISHSSVERVILPDSTIMLDYLLHLTTFIVEGLDVDPERMRENLELSHGLVYSQRVLLKLTDAGLARQVAYEIVQRNAMRAWKERRPFFELLAADPSVTARLSPDELKSCFDPAFYLKNVDAIFKRLGLTQ